MSEHDELESSVAAWVLGAVDAADEERVRAHVDTCPECQATISRLGLVAGSLALAVDEVALPAGLRERILTAAATTSPVERAAEPRIVHLPVKRPAPRPLHRLPLSGVAAAVAIALLAGVLIGDVAGRNSVPPPAPSQVAHFSLQGHGPLQAASATVVDLKSDGIAFVSFSGLPSVPDGKVYELWLITPDNRADPAGTFVPDTGGSRVLVVDRALAGYKLMAVTVEAGPEGVQAPTQQPLIYGSVA